MSPKKRDGLEIEEDLRHQRREWAFQRVGWTVMAVIVVAALLGLFGQGPLSWSSVTAGAASVDYERFLRYGGETDLTVRVERSAIRAGEVRVELGRDFIGNMRVESIVPEPESVEAGPDVYRYTFAVSESDLTARFGLKPNALGFVRGSVAVDGGPPAEFRSFIFP